MCSPGGSAGRHTACVMRRGTRAAHRGRIQGRTARPQWRLFGRAEPAFAVQSGIGRLETGWRQQHRKAGRVSVVVMVPRLLPGGGAGCAPTRRHSWQDGHLRRDNRHHQEALLGAHRERRPRRSSTTMHRESAGDDGVVPWAHGHFPGERRCVRTFASVVRPTRRAPYMGRRSAAPGVP